MNYRNPNKKQKNRKLTEKEFQQIVSRAFSPDLPEPKFSAKYYQHRQELERKVAMKDSKKSRKNYRPEHTGKAGFALMTACVTGMAGLAIYSGIGIYKVGRTMDAVQQETSQPDFGVGAEVQVDTPDTQELQAELLEDSQGLYDFQVEFSYGETDPAMIGLNYKVVLNWIPDGLEYREDGPYGMKYHNYQDETDEHAITPYGAYQVSDDSTFSETVNFAESVTETSFDRDVYPGIVNEKHMFWVRRGQGFDLVYVHFKGTPCIVSYYINGFTDEEVEKFVENMTLVETDEAESMFEIYSENNRDITFSMDENEYTRNGGAYALQLNWNPGNLQILE